MSETLAAWSVAFACAIFAGFFEWIKDKNEFHLKLGPYPEKKFTEADIIYQCGIYKIEIPNIISALINHMIQPLMFFVIFKSFISPSHINITIKGLIVLYYVGFFLYDDFVGKNYKRCVKYFCFQIVNWAVALAIFSDFFNVFNK